MRTSLQFRVISRYTNFAPTYPLLEKTLHLRTNYFTYHTERPSNSIYSVWDPPQANETRGFSFYKAKGTKFTFRDYQEYLLVPNSSILLPGSSIDQGILLA